jgi:hypothetical protein
MDMRCTMKIYLIPDEYETSIFRSHYKTAWEKLRTRQDKSIKGAAELFEQNEMKGSVYHF